MYHRTQKSWMSTTLALLVLLSLLLSACAPKATVKPAEATQPPPAPAATETTVPTNTPEPTSTPEPTATATATETPKPTATATPDRTATAEVKLTEAAAAALEKIAPSLEEYGYRPDEGHLVWSSDEPYKLTSTSYLERRYYKLEDVGKVSDFIIQTKVKWETSSGLAGCEIILRAEDDIEQGKNMKFFIMRLQNAPAWDLSVWEFGRYQYSPNGNNFMFTNKINDKNESTNVIALVVKGQNIVPWINGHKQRLLEETKLKSGGIALSSYQESGKTTCTFSDTWVWAIDK